MAMLHQREKKTIQSYIIIPLQRGETRLCFPPCDVNEGIPTWKLPIFCCVYDAASVLTMLCARDSDAHHITLAVENVQTRGVITHGLVTQLSTIKVNNAKGRQTGKPGETQLTRSLIILPQETRMIFS